MTSRLRISLAASGGGHLRQLLDLQPFWQEHESHFVTEATPLARKLSASHVVHVVPHFAFGQFRREPWRGIRAALRNMKASWRAMNVERPQLIISTGAGSAFFTVLFAKFRGARFILIETFARFDSPSLFGRLARPFADTIIVQSERLRRIWPDAEIFDPLVVLGPASGTKDDLGLITVGTVTPFNRLVRGVASLDHADGRPSRIIAQVGDGGFRPEGFEAKEHMEFDEMTALLDRANVVFCHGGTGSLITALRAGCRIVAMPRRADLGEHYDDHQSEVVNALAARGLIEAAADVSELKNALARALAKQPQTASTDHSALIERLRELTAKWFGTHAERQLPG